MKDKNENDFFLCYAIGRRGVSHAWGKGKTQEEAQKECELAVRESIQENPSKTRHAPYAFMTKAQKADRVLTDSEIKAAMKDY